MTCSHLQSLYWSARWRVLLTLSTKAPRFPARRRKRLLAIRKSRNKSIRKKMKSRKSRKDMRHWSRIDKAYSQLLQQLYPQPDSEGHTVDCERAVDWFLKRASIRSILDVGCS